MLEGFRSFVGRRDDDAFREAARTRIRDLRRKDPRWNVLAGSVWLCPYCGEAGVASLTESENLPEAILGHLEGGCPAWKRFEGALWDLARLKGRAAFLEADRVLRESIPKDKRFSRREETGRWCCPFCGEETDVALADRRRFDGAVLSRMAAHLTRCPKFQEGAPREAAELDAAIAARALRRRLEKDLQRAGRDPLWTERDLAGNWYCPFCAEAVAVPSPAEGLATAANGSALRGHLAACEPYAKGSPPGDLRPKVEIENRKQTLAVRIRALLGSDARWTKADDYCYWICPACGEAVPSVNLGDPDEFEKKAPLGIADHLVVHCPKFDESALLGAPPGGGPQGRERHSLLDELQVLKKESEVHKDLDRTLADARKVQLSMLPPAPKVPGFEFRCFYRPCSQLGGDFYDFVELSDGRIGIAVGDVSGHGIDAALVMGVVKKLLQVYGRLEVDPIRPLVHTNREICRDLDPSIFITVFYGILDPQRKTLEFARAGHTSLLRVNPSAPHPLVEWSPRGMALGVDGGPLFEKVLDANRIILSEGDFLLLATDGLVEARNAEGELFGEERLKETLLMNTGRPLEEVFGEIERRLREFCGRDETEDDITLVGVRVGE